MPSSPTPNSDTYGTRSSRASLPIPISIEDDGSRAPLPIPISIEDDGSRAPGSIKTLGTVTAIATDVTSGRGLRIAEADSDVVIKFKVTPEMSESGNANYIEEGDLRAASSILIYMGSPSRTFSINAKLVSRTKEEAAENFKILNILRGWRMPRPGQEPLDASGVSLETATNSPQILLLRDSNFYDVQVIMRSINIEFGSDVDRIPVAGKEDFLMPIILPVSMSFQEIHSYEDMELFDLISYKEGTLVNW